MLKRSTIILLTLLAATVNAQERVQNSLGFESGAIQPNGRSADSGFIQTLPDPQSGANTISTGQGGCGPTSNCDMRVLRSERIDGQDVTPRAGDFFLRMRLDKNKDYTGLNGGPPKPRNALSFGHEAFRIDHDVEGWIGFSIFLPTDYEDETGQIGLILSEIHTDSSAQYLKLLIDMESGESHWFLEYRTTDSSISGGTARTVDLGSIEPDKGKWTDFVIRHRSNPFDVDTNPAAEGIPDAKDKLYKANKGILQVWKAEGSVVDNAGNRQMVIKIDKVNTPVGLVPGTRQGKDKIGYNLRAYKPGWQGHTGRSTSVAGPIWIAWDEVRFGEAIKHDTGYQDVHPTALACTDRCPGNSAAPPPPPDNAPPMPPGSFSAGD